MSLAQISTVYMNRLHIERLWRVREPLIAPTEKHPDLPYHSDDHQGGPSSSTQSVPALHHRKLRRRSVHMCGATRDILSLWPGSYRAGRSVLSTMKADDIMGMGAKVALHQDIAT
ncbi:hypothetical protein HIM_07781 [Hirsutella minnesotensis 3608]|uniref:Uncharacterized protein n=1 Tax=Hirsutella minnesotensis 3608 TaxID=1043627 RepID=A0A0F7ZYP6_9HYPO|nr:hypothetical protein HIM_07781 [Hirsutella minnesotensis 3608]